jgi:hypothetical protein
MIQYHDIVNFHPSYISFSLLTHSRHNTLGLGSNSIFTPPQTRHRLCLSKEGKTGFAVESACTASSYRLLVAGKGEHGERNGDGDVDADLTGFDVALEAGGCGARVCEDSDAL